MAGFFDTLIGYGNKALNQPQHDFSSPADYDDPYDQARQLTAPNQQTLPIANNAVQPDVYSLPSGYNQRIMNSFNKLNIPAANNVGQSIHPAHQVNRDNFQSDVQSYKYNPNTATAEQVIKQFNLQDNPNVQRYLQLMQNPANRPKQVVPKEASIQINPVGNTGLGDAQTTYNSGNIGSNKPTNSNNYINKYNEIRKAREARLANRFHTKATPVLNKNAEKAIFNNLGNTDVLGVLKANPELLKNPDVIRMINKLNKVSS